MRFPTTVTDRQRWWPKKVNPHGLVREGGSKIRRLYECLLRTAAPLTYIEGGVSETFFWRDGTARTS